MTIRKRFSLYILVPLISALVILSIFDYFYSSWFLEKKASLMLLSEAETINNEIQQSIRYTKSDLALLLANRMIKEYVMYSRLGLLDYAEDERWKIEEDFLKVAMEKPEYVSIRFVGLDGKSTIDIINKKISYGHFHFSDEDWFFNALNLGKEESFVSPLHLDKYHNKPAISVSRLYYDDTGEKGGIISLHIYADKFFQRILEKTIGEKGYAYLIDNRGVIVAHKDAAVIGAAVKEYESSKRVIAGNIGTITEFDKINAALMKKAYMPLKIEGLYLVVSRPLKEITSFGVQMQLLNLILFIATVLFASIISSIVAKRISKPIKELRQETEIIETGNMDHRIDIKTGDEIEQLAASFNKMVAGLKQKTDALRESEEKLRAIFDNAMDGILVADVEEEKFFTGNKMICKMLGYSMDEIKGLGVIDIHPEKDLPYVIEQFKKQSRGEFTLAGDIPVKRKDGSVFYAEINSSPVTLTGKTYLIGMFRDITERKRAEKELMDEKTFSDAVINSLPGIFYLYELEEDGFHLVKWNKNHETKTGYSAKELLHLSPLEDWFEGDDIKRVAVLIEQIRRSREASAELDLRMKDGATIPYFLTGSLLKREGKEYFLGVGIDITQRKQAEKELKRHREHLEELVRERTAELEDKTEKLEKSETSLRYLLEDVNESRSELEKANEKLKELDCLKSMFIASMSHELRTPLNSIIGFTGLILQGMTGEINAEQKDQLQRVYGSAKHLLALITDVIDISKIEAGKVEIFTEEFRLDEIIKEAISSMKAQIDDKGLGLEISIPQGMKMRTDRRRLLQCILNYLSNAVKFSEKGKISIIAGDVNRMVEIKVKDPGIGIKEEDLPRLFNSFVRLDSPFKVITPGTGLGLYLTRKLVTDILGGTVSVESLYGQGSTFAIKIPMELKKYTKFKS